MTWQITFTSNFLKNIYCLPKAVRNKLPDVMKALENDPSPRNGYSLKIKERSLWRIPLSRRYRIFYQYHESWVKLIKVVLRNEHTYKNGDLDGIEKDVIEESNIPDWFIDDVIEDEFQRIDEKMLKIYDVPKIYWDELIKLGKERDEEKYQDNLIEYIVNHVSDPEAQEQILNCCTNQLLSQLEHQASYSLSQQDYSLFFSIDKHFSQENKLPDLILKLSEEQKKILELPFDKPILVKGGAGTGKTVLAVHRASEIARSQKKSGDNSKILFVTYTYSLVTYIRELLESLLKTNNLKQDYNIELYALDELALEYYQTQNENLYIPKIIDNVTALTLLRESYEVKNYNNFEIENYGGIDFILDEFIYYIEARGLESSDQYRQLRSRQLGRDLPNLIWNIYETWREKVDFAGYITADSLRSKAYKIIKEKQYSPSYKTLIIDEAQDLSPVALNFLALLIPDSNNIFITADVEQSLYQRSCGWNHIEASFGHNLKQRVLKDVFRNTKQIAAGCQFILLPEEREKDYNLRVNSISESSLPMILLTDNDRLKVEKIKDFYEINLKKNGLSISSGVVLTPNSNYSRITANRLKVNNINAEYIQPEEISRKNNFIQILDLNSVKGLEFPFVVIMGLNEGLFPYYSNQTDDNKQEIIKQQRKLFYVGCSRAIYSLLLIGNRSNHSTFLNPLKENNYWQVEEF